MTRIRFLVLGVFVLAGGSALLSGGAELRSTVGERQIIRRTSYAWLQEPAEELPRPEAVLPEGESSVLEGLRPDFQAGPPPLVEYGGPACGKGPCWLECLCAGPAWGRFDFLLWWRKGQSLPPLVITSSDNMNLNNLRLGPATTSVLFGGDSLGDEARPGGRVTVGSWLDPCATHAVEGRFFSLGEETVRFGAESAGNTPLGRPFTDGTVNPPNPTSRTLAFPGFNSDGVVDISASSEVLGGDALYRVLCSTAGCTRLFLLTGYQYARINEDLIISDSTFIIAQNNRQAITDSFVTRNEYHAAQVGLAVEFENECWRVDLLAKIGFGNMSQRVDIRGSTTNNIGGAGPVEVMPPLGLLAIDNQGSFTRDKFAVSPEVGINVHYRLNECTTIVGGYSFIYWSSVVQPGDQIPAGLLVPETFTFTDSSYWLHGMNLGVEIRL